MISATCVRGLSSLRSSDSRSGCLYMSPLRRQFRRGFQERLGVGMNGTRRDSGGVGHFDDFSAVHDGDAGGEVAHHRHGMRDEEVGEAEVALQLCEQVDDLRADADVEGGDGLVAHDEFGAEREGAGDADALALASGEFVRVAASGRIRRGPRRGGVR